MKKSIIIGIVALFAVLAISTASAQSVFYLVPDNSSTPGYCNTIEVGIWLNATVPVMGGIFDILYTHCCANITDYEANTTFFEEQSELLVNGRMNIDFGHWVGALPANQPVGVYHIGNFTVHCCNETYCKTDIIFDDVELYNEMLDEIPFTTDNGTFTCGEPSEESFSKDLYAGWNLISLPLTPSANSTDSVFASVSENVSDVYSYNATSKQFESTSTMDPGVGYFVRIMQNCTWTYSGTSAYDSMTTELKPGLNMIGWLNCTKQIIDLTTIDGKHWYAARWNAAEQEFETYNPVAPNGFNDFTAMDRGNGYFVSAKEVTTLNENC